RGPQAGLRQIGRVGEPCGLPDHDTNAGTPLTTGRQLLDLAVVEPGRRDPPILDEHLGKVATRAQCGPEHPLHHRLVDHDRTPSHWLRRAYLRTVASMPVQTGVSATVMHVVDEEDTAIALHSGAVPVLGTPRIVALFEEAACRALEGGLAEGETSVGLRVEVTHLAPTKVGSTVR